MSENSELHIALREYFERILDEREKALVLTARNLEERLTHLNDLRITVEKDRSEFVKMGEYSERHRAMEATITKMNEVWVERFQEVRSSQNRLIGMGIILLPLSAVLGAIMVHMFIK